MFISSFKEVAVVAQREGFRARSSCDLYEKIQKKLHWTRVAHSEEMVGLKTISGERIQQLEKVGINLERVRVEAQVYKAQVDDLQGRLESSEA